jgi:hypothetical protein
VKIEKHAAGSRFRDVDPLGEHPPAIHRRAARLRIDDTEARVHRRLPLAHRGNVRVEPPLPLDGHPQHQRERKAPPRSPPVVDEPRVRRQPGATRRFITHREYSGSAITVPARTSRSWWQPGAAHLARGFAATS